MNQTRSWQGAIGDFSAPSLGKGIILLQVLYVLLTAGYSIANGYFPSLIHILIICVSAFLWTSKDRAFLISFMPFLLILMSYESLRSIADSLAPGSIHVTDIIGWELALFGGALPAAVVQQALSNRWFTPLIDLTTNILYMSHYVTPLILAIVVWQNRRAAYWPFMFGLVVLSYAGFATYVLFPAAPPWWATYYGYLTGDLAVPNISALRPHLLVLGPNPVAAMPSLHAAYPAYLALYSLLVWRKRAAAMLLLPLGVSFSAVYLGHHYVVDILAGFLYAAVVVGAVTVPLFLWTSRSPLPAVHTGMAPQALPSGSAGR